jgi:O-antigen/teichoic acid export membrane protein
VKRLVHLSRHRFVRNVASLQVGAALNGVSGLVSSILLAHVLGAADQGEYYTSIAVWAFLTLFANPALVQVTVNQIAGAAARGLLQKTTDWMAFLVKAFVVLGAALPVVAWFVLPWIGSLLDVMAKSLGHEVPGFPIELAWILTFTQLVELPRQVVGAAFQGTRRMTLLAKTENGQEVVRVFCVVTGAAVTGSPLGAVIGMLAASSVGSVMALDLYRQARASDGYPLPPFGAVLRRAVRLPLRPGLRLCVRMGILRNIDSFSFDILPAIVLRTFAGAEWVAYFKIAYRIMNVPTVLMQGVSRTALPAMSELRGLTDLDRFRRHWLRVTLFAGVIVAAGILLFLPLVPLLTRHFYPRGYSEPIWTLVVIMAVGAVPNSFCLALDSFFIVADRLRVALVLGVTGVVVCTLTLIGLSIAMPETGPAWGYTVQKLWPLLSLAYIAYWFRTHREGGGWGEAHAGDAVGEGDVVEATREAAR